MRASVTYNGAKIGKLTVIRRQCADDSGRPLLLCLCECGRATTIRQNRLTGKRKTLSCGCLVKENNKRKRHSYGEASAYALYCKYKDSSQKRGLSFRITFEDFKSITSSNCHYCGSPPQSICKRKTNFGEYKYNGIDRMNNNLGYVLDNSVPCCVFCNYAKHKRTYDEFRSWIKRIVQFTNYKQGAENE